MYSAESPLQDVRGVLSRLILAKPYKMKQMFETSGTDPSLDNKYNENGGSIRSKCYHFHLTQLFFPLQNIMQPWFINFAFLKHMVHFDIDLSQNYMFSITPPNTLIFLRWNKEYCSITVPSPLRKLNINISMLQPPPISTWDHKWFSGSSSQAQENSIFQQHPVSLIK